MTLILPVLTITVIVCFIVSIFVACFWFVLHLIKKHKNRLECMMIRKAVLESLKDGPLERSKILEWLEAQGICDESDGDYEIDNLLGSDFIRENEDSYHKQSNIIIEDDEQTLEITSKGKQKLRLLGKK